MTRALLIALSSLLTIPLLHATELQSDSVVLDKKTTARALAIRDLDNIPAELPQQHKISSDEIAEIDLLVVYTTTAADNSTEDITEKITKLIQRTNSIYSSSAVYIRFNVVDMVAVDHIESTLNSENMGPFYNGASPHFSDIKNLRYELGADMVILLTHVGGGIAQPAGFAGSLKGFESEMYAVASIDSPSIVAHELGHNLGLAHSRHQGEIGLTFPFALGHYLSEFSGTIMSYAGINTHAFSNPNIDCSGSPCGVDKEDFHNGADAVYALNAVRFEAEAMYQKNPDLTLAYTLLENTNNNPFAVCIQTNNNKYPSIINTIHCDAFAIENLQGIEYFPLLTELKLTNNQLSSIEGIASGPLLQTVNLSNNALEDISELSQLENLTALNLGHNNITDISFFMDESVLQQAFTIIDLSHNPIKDVSALVPALPFTLLLAGSNGLYCWQRDYLKHQYENYYFGGDPSSFPDSCDDSQDQLDFNNNGVSNRADIEAETNPFLEIFDINLAFTLDEIEVNEDAGHVRLAVHRVGGDSTKEVSARIFINPKIESSIVDNINFFQAIEGMDYTAINELITFPANVMSVNVDVAIINDEAYRADKTFLVQLAKPTLATISYPDAVIVKILEDDPSIVPIIKPSPQPTPVQMTTNNTNNSSGGGGGSLGFWFLLIFGLLSTQVRFLTPSGLASPR